MKPHKNFSLTCNICNTIFKTNRHFGNHLKGHNISSKEYFDKFIGSPKKCIKCDKEAEND